MTRLDYDCKRPVLFDSVFDSGKYFVWNSCAASEVRSALCELFSDYMERGLSHLQAKALLVCRLDGNAES